MEAYSAIILKSLNKGGNYTGMQAGKQGYWKGVKRCQTSAWQPFMLDTVKHSLLGIEGKRWSFQNCISSGVVLLSKVKKELLSKNALWGVLGSA